MKIYCKWLDSGKYSEAAFNKDGNLYILFKVEVQRGMGHQRANELLIYGMPKSNIKRYCLRKNCRLILREDEPPIEMILILNSKEEALKKCTNKLST